MMRLDKFLKISRLIKRRSVAKSVCDQGRVLVNGRPAKAASRVEVGDQVTIEFGNKDVVIEVLELQDSTKRQDAAGMYQLVSESPAKRL